MHLNSLAASDSKESIVNLTYEVTGSSNNSHAQNYILLVLFEVDLYMKRNYFCQSCSAGRGCSCWQSQNREDEDDFFTLS